MADAAADLVEGCASGVHVCVDRTAWRHFRVAHEEREQLDIHAFVIDPVYGIIDNRPVRRQFVRRKGLVIPISFTYASAANETRLTC